MREKKLSHSENSARTGLHDQTVPNSWILQYKMGFTHITENGKETPTPPPPKQHK